MNWPVDLDWMPSVYGLACGSRLKFISVWICPVDLDWKASVYGLACGYRLEVFSVFIGLCI